jgi:hypothetical protein
VAPERLDLRAELEADLAGLSDLAHAAPGAASAASVQLPTDEAYLVGAAYVAVVAAADAGALLRAAESFATREPGPVGVRFLSSCAQLGRIRAALQRELGEWAADRGPDAAERAVLTARALTVDLAELLRR